MYDLAIIGGGPGAVAAGVYAARKLLKTVFITDTFGGQSIESPEIQNWIGTEKISGIEFGKALEAHLRAYGKDVLDIVKGERVASVVRGEEGFVVKTDKHKSVSARTVLVTSGGVRRRLTAKGADVFEQKGLTYCASCDGPLFSGMDVVVIGGGNAGFETAAQLLAYAKSVTLLQHKDAYSADPVTIEKVLGNPIMHGILNAETMEIFGSTFVEGVRYKDMKTGEEHAIHTSGVFVEIGLVPSTDFIRELVEVDPYRRIIVDPKTQRTSVPGVWAAGDCTNGLYHQNNIAAGDAVKALEDMYLYLKTEK